MRTVARAAGVAPATVAKALRDDPYALGPLHAQVRVNRTGKHQTNVAAVRRLLGIRREGKFLGSDGSSNCF